MRILAAMDKFKGTLSARDAADAVCAGATGHDCIACPIGDGGDGTIDAFGGANQLSIVTGPDGSPVKAGWRLSGGFAYIEMAAASGIVVATDDTDPVNATTVGTGQLIREAIELGAEEVFVGVGGSATTDGGRGALAGLEDIISNGRLPVPVTVLCDVDVVFTRAADVFGPQKGATPGQVEILRDRLSDMRRSWLDWIDVDTLPGSGAAGGLAGGLASVGAQLRSGFDTVAERLGLEGLVRTVDLVITGEGQFDATSRLGKATGGMLDLADAHGIPSIVIAGHAAESNGTVLSLVDRFGSTSFTEPAVCLRRATYDLLKQRWPS